MANDQIEPITPVETPVVETPAPAVETPVVETVAETPAPEVVVEPVVEAPAVEAVTEEVKVEETEKKETLLAEDKKSEEAPKVEDVKVDEAVVEATEEKKEEGGQSDEPAPPPSYEAFVLPENVQLDAERMTEFTGLLASLELDGKADHAVVQQFGQKALDFHINELQKQVENIQTVQMDAWEKVVTGWKDETVNHPLIGGPRLQETLESANKFIKTHGGTAEQQKELRTILNTSGLGSHPAIVTLFANAGGNMSEGRPLAAQTPVSAPKSRTETMYGRRK